MMEDTLSQPEHTDSIDNNEMNLLPLEDGGHSTHAAVNKEKNQKAEEDSDVEIIETDEEEVEDITIIEISDTEIREEEDSEEQGGEEEFVIKEEPVDDFVDEFVNFDPSQLGVIVTETELPDDLIGEPINGVYKCKFCPQKFPNKSRLIAHIERHINNGAIRKCRFCEFFTAVTQTLKEHECKHTKEKPYQCSICSFRCRLKGDLARHEEVHTNNKRYQCKECGHRTRTAANLRRHMERHQPDMPRNFICRLCGFAFKRDSALKMHMNRRHNDVKPFFCDQCSFSCKTMWELKSHKAKHSDDHPYQCSWPGCNKTFKTKSDCSKHIKRHTGVKNYECSLCCKKFFSTAQLRRHASTHTDVRNFECGECLKKFKTLRALKGHLLTHQRIKPFSCSVCYKTFGTQFNLDMHNRVHEGGRPYQCPICVHGSREMEHLMAHVGSEHLHNFTYVCSLCRKPFGKSSQLQLHVQRCHKEDMRGREETVVYDPEYLDLDFQPEPSGTFDASTFAKYLASETLKAVGSSQCEGTVTTVKQEPGANNSSDDSGVSSVSNSSPEDCALPEALHLPPVVQLGRYGGIPFCLTRKNSGFQLNCQKKGKKPKRWFMDMSQMTERDVEKHKEYLKKKELGLLPQRCWGRSSKVSYAKRGTKANTKQKPLRSGKAKRKWKLHKHSWTDEEEDSDEEDACLLAQQLMMQLEKEGTENRGGSKSQRFSSRARKPAVHFKNLPYDSFEGTHKAVSTSRKAHIADLGFCQPSTSCYLGGKAANWKQNKRIMKKKPPQMSNSSKKKPKKNAAALSKQSRRRSSCGKKKVKDTEAVMENSWALALAGPLPVSHYKAEETAMNTRCWLNAVRSAATRGYFGLAPSMQNKENCTCIDQGSDLGGLREEFFTQCLKLRARAPKDKTADDSLALSVSSTSVLQEGSACEDGVIGHVPEEKDCLDNTFVRTGGDSSSAELQICDESLPGSTEDPCGVITWQAVNECLQDIVEAVSEEQTASQEVSLSRNSENDTETLVDTTPVPSLIIMSDVEANSMWLSESTSNMIDQSRRGDCDSAERQTPSGAGLLDIEHSATSEERNGDHTEEDGHIEYQAESIKDNFVSAVHPLKNKSRIDEGDGSQDSTQTSQNVNDSSNAGCATHGWFEDNMAASSAGAWPENNSESSHNNENGQRNNCPKQCKDTETRRITHTACQQSDYFEMHHSVNHSSENSVPVSIDTWQNSHGCRSQTTDDEGPLKSTGKFLPHTVSTTTNKQCLAESQSQEMISSEETSGVEVQSVKNIAHSESCRDRKFGESMQKESKDDEKIFQVENSAAKLHLQENIEQNDFSKARHQLEDNNINERENCPAELKTEEKFSEASLQSEMTVCPQYSLSTGKQSLELVSVLNEISTSSVADQVSLKESKEISMEITAHVSENLANVSQDFHKKGLEVLPESVCSAADGSRICSPAMQMFPQETCGQLPADNLLDPEETFHSVTGEYAAIEQSVVEYNVLFTKCLHVLVADVQSNPCTLDYLHSLGVSKVSLHVHHSLSNCKQQKFFKHSTQKILKPKPGKNIKQSVPKAMKPSKNKKQKANTPQLKKSKGKAAPAKPLKNKVEKSVKKSVKEQVTAPSSVLPAGKDSGISGISGFLLATATVAKRGRSLAKTSSKPVKSKHKRAVVKAMPKAVRPVQGKSPSKVKRLSGKDKQLSSKTSPQKSSQQLSRGKKKQKLLKKSSVDFRHVEKQTQAEDRIHRPMFGLSSSDNISVKLESEEPESASISDAKTLGQGVDFATTGALANSLECAAVASYSNLDTHQALSAGRSVPYKDTAPEKEVGCKKTNTDRSSVEKIYSTRTKKKSPKSACKKKMTVVKSCKKSVKPKQVSVTASSNDEDLQSNLVAEDGGKMISSDPSTSQHDVSEGTTAIVATAAPSSPGKSPVQVLEASRTEHPETVKLPPVEKREHEAVVSVEPSPVINADDNALPFCLNESAVLSIPDQGWEAPVTMSSHVNSSNRTVPEAPVENTLKPRKRGRSSKTKKELCTTEKKSFMKKTYPGRASKPSSRAHFQLCAKIRQAQAGCAKSNLKASMQKKAQCTAASAIANKFENSAFKITKPDRTVSQSTQSKKKAVKSYKKNSKTQSIHCSEKDMSKKRKRFMYVETDTGEYPDPPAKKRGRRPRPKIILDRSQVNLCLEPAELSLSAEPGQGSVCVAAEAGCFDEEGSSLLLSATMMLNESSLVCDNSETPFIKSEPSTEFVQSGYARDVSALPLPRESCLVHVTEGQLTGYAPFQPTDSQTADIKPIVSELNSCIHPDVRPRIEEFSMVNGSAMPLIVPTEMCASDTSLATDQPELQATWSLASAASLGKEEDARVALLQVLTNHLDTSENSSFEKHQCSQSSITSLNPRVKPVLAGPSRGRKRKAKDHSFHVQAKYKQALGIFEDIDRRRSDRRKKLRLTEEQIRLAAGQDSADSDFDEEERDLTYERSHLSADREDVGSDIEFLSADYSHVDLGTERLSLEDLRMDTFSFADISEEGSAVEGDGTGEGVAPSVPGPVVTGEIVNVSELAAGVLANGANANFSLNTQTLISSQEIGMGAHVVQGHSSPLGVSAPLMPKIFTVKASGDACMVVSVDKSNQTHPVFYNLESHQSSTDIGNTNISQVPIGSEGLFPQSQRTNQVEVPIGSELSPEGTTSLTISVKTSDGQNVFLEDCPQAFL